MSTLNDIQTNITKVVPELNNTSNSSILQRIIAVFANFVDIVKLEISNSSSIISNAAKTSKVSTRAFYIEKSLAFQYGDVLTIIDQNSLAYGYATINETLQIIKQVNVKWDTTQNIIIVNVATANADGYLEALSSVQLSSFITYLYNFIPLGVQFQITSATPSIFNCQTLFIRYSKLYNLTTIQENVSKTLMSFQQALRGGSPLFVNDIESALRTIAGVKDATLFLPTIGGVAPINGILNLPVGYFNFNEVLINQSAVSTQPNYIEWSAI